jgi:hypothetical protein
MISPEACGDLSLACGSPPPERMDRLPWSACITSLGACGWSPLERVDHFPSCAWMASLGASERVDVPWVTLMGSLDHRQAARSCGPTCGCTLMRAHASHTSTKRAGDSAQAQRQGAQQPACVHLCSSFVAEDLFLVCSKTQTIFGPQLFTRINKLFKSTFGFLSYKSSV